MAMITFDRARTQSNWLVPMALVAFGSLAAWKASEFTGLRFKPFQTDALMGDLTALFLISLFLERTLEVFLATWRDFGRVQLQQEVDRADGAAKSAADAKAAAEKALAAAPGDPKAVAALADAAAPLQEAERCALQKQHELDAYKTQTARASFICGLVAGVVIAIAGARALSPLLAELPAPGSPQLLVVTIVDVLVTAGLIGGGSDGIHKLVSVITDYLDATRDKVAGK